MASSYSAKSKLGQNNRPASLVGLAPTTAPAGSNSSSPGFLKRVGRKISQMAKDPFDLSRLDGDGNLSANVRPAFSAARIDAKREAAASASPMSTVSASPAMSTGSQRQATAALSPPSTAASSYYATPDLLSSASSPTTSAAGPETSDIHLEYYLSIIHSHAKETASISEETRRIIARRKELEAGIRATPIQAPYAVRKAAHQMVERKRKEVAKNAAESARAEYAEAKLAYQIKAAEATRIKDAEHWEQIKQQKVKVAAAKAKEKAKYDLLYGAVPSRASSSAAKAAQVRDVMRANGLASSDLTSEEGQHAHAYVAYRQQGGVSMPQYEELLAKLDDKGNTDAAILGLMEAAQLSQARQNNEDESQRRAQHYADELARLTSLGVQARPDKRPSPRSPPHAGGPLAGNDHNAQIMFGSPPGGEWEQFPPLADDSLVPGGENGTPPCTIYSRPGQQN